MCWLGGAEGHGGALATCAATALLPDKKARASRARRALPGARRCVPQWRSERGARGRRNQRMARTLRRNGWSGARGSNGDGGVMRVWSGGERAREGGWTSANGSGGGGGHGRALLVADQGVSRPAHARHAAAELCWLATAAQHGRPSRMDAGVGAGWGKAPWWAGPASASGPEARPRPARAPLFSFPFF